MVNEFVVFCSTYRSGCPYGIWINITADGEHLIISKMHGEHNHDIIQVSVVLNCCVHI